MKKPLILSIVIALALGVSACSPNKQETDSKDKAKSEQKVDKFIYGKVKNIVGNEIEFELAKDPGKEIKAVDKDKDDKEKEKKDEIPASMTTKAMSGDEGKKVSVGDIEKNEPLVDLEFTGDVKTILIPTGVDINVLSGRSGEGINTIKEGTYLKIAVDDNKSENPTVLSVDVIS